MICTADPKRTTDPDDGDVPVTVAIGLPVTPLT
jgi:hypothetical protein